MINPALSAYPAEAKLLGEMVLGYGELDLGFVMAAGIVTRQGHSLIHAVNQLRSETNRLDVIHALVAGPIASIGLLADYTTAHGALRHCLKLRNQWAHSQWADMKPHGLAFAEIDGNAFAPPLRPLQFYSITLGLLQKQEAYFEYCRLCILSLETNIQQTLHARSQRVTMPPEMHKPHTRSQWTRHALAHIEQARPRLP